MDLLPEYAIRKGLEYDGVPPQQVDAYFAAIKRGIARRDSSSSNANMARSKFPPTPSRSRGRSGSGSSMGSVRFTSQRAPAAQSSLLNRLQGRAMKAVSKAAKITQRHGLLSGKLAPQSKIKKGKKYRLRKEGGVHYVVEKGKVITSQANSQAVYIGHTSTPLHTILRATWIALFNKLMSKASVQPYSNAAGISFLTSTLIVVSYKIDGAAITQDSYSVAGGGSATGETFATWAMDNARLWNNRNTEATVEFYRMATFDSVYNPAVRSNVEIRLWGTKVEYKAKSSLKMQNRTKTGASTSTDVVDDVPLYGKAYGGKGTGPTFSNPLIQNVSFLADNSYGVIEYLPASTEEALQEPFDPIELARVKTSGKISIEAGQIKTSVVKDSGKMYFNTFMRQLLPRINLVQSTPPKLPNLRVGQYKFYGLEKVMNVDNAVNISVAYECQHNITVGVKETRNKITSTYFVSNLG